MGNRHAVERFSRAMSEDDFDTQDALVHDDYILDYPQSGERIRGRANLRALIEQYPAESRDGNEAVVRPDRRHGRPVCHVAIPSLERDPLVRALATSIR